MALKFGEASFEQFERGEGKENLQIEPLLDGSNVEVSSPNPPKIANPDELTSCWGIIKPVGLVLQNGEWTFVSSHASYVADSLFLRGDRFEETPCGIFELRAGERKSKLTNANVRIDSIRDVYIDDENKETFLVCAVSCREAWGDEEKLIEISSKNYKSVFKKIREEFRDVQLSTQSMDALDEYLSKVNQRDAKDDGIDLPHEVRSLYTGWLTINGKAKYYIGESDFYKGYLMPEIPDSRRLEVFNAGFGFREVGHCNNVIETLFLFAHTAYTNYFFEKAGCPMRTLIFLKGRTNLFKTSTVSALANVFSTSTNDCGIRLSSTPASLREYVVLSRDGLALVDDFSNSTGADNAKMENNGELLVRAVGDGKFSSAMSMSESKKIQTRQVRAAVILTGEEMINLSQSSLFRILTLEVVQGTFDGNVLRTYEDKQILREYFALFIKFLSEGNSQVIEYCRTTFPRYREYYKSELSVPRFIDFAAIMALEADIICGFARWCGVSEQFVAEYRERTIGGLLSVLMEHQEQSKEQDYVKRFLQALFHDLNTGKVAQIAENEKIFSDNPSLYIGFFEESTRTLWLLFEEAFKIVSEHYRKLNEAWLVKGSTIKEELAHRKISVARLKSEGAEKNEFLKRAKKAKIGNSRPRMLVLRLDMVENILSEDGMEV